MDQWDETGSPVGTGAAGSGELPATEPDSLERLYRLREEAAHRALDLTGWLTSTQAKIVAAMAEHDDISADPPTSVGPDGEPDRLARLREQAAELSRQLGDANTRLSEYTLAIAGIESRAGGDTSGETQPDPARSDTQSMAAQSVAAVAPSSPSHRPARTSKATDTDPVTEQPLPPQAPQVRWEP